MTERVHRHQRHLSKLYVTLHRYITKARPALTLYQEEVGAEPVE